MCVCVGGGGGGSGGRGGVQYYCKYVTGIVGQDNKKGSSTKETAVWLWLDTTFRLL